MKFFNRPFLRYALGAGHGAAVLGLGACSNLQQANPSESDFVKMLNSQGQKHYHWSDYLADSHGHEVFKNLTLENNAGKVWVGELVLDNFKYDKNTDAVNADHIHANHVSLQSTRGMRITDEDLDIPKLVPNDQISDTKVDITRLLFFRSGEGPAVNSDTIVIPQASYSLTKNYVTDDALIDVSAFVKGTLNAHFRADYVGAKSLKQFEDTH